MSIIDAVNIIMMGIMDAWRWVTNVVSTVIITAFGFSLGGIFLYFWQKEKQREETSISSWLDRIKKIEDIDIDNTGNPNKFFEIDISFIKEIEAYRNFKNILWYCPILKAVWNDFKNSIVE